MSKINVTIDLNKRRVDAIELSNDRVETIDSFKRIRDVIEDFSNEVSRRLSEPEEERLT